MGDGELDETGRAAEVDVVVVLRLVVVVHRSAHQSEDGRLLRYHRSQYDNVAVAAELGRSIQDRLDVHRSALLPVFT